ncbi:glycosyltransferase family protein [Flavobacterium daemonense]|uniref:glycosyltransferase n=1 Tax=Flavobacterium daemonense TaxID=1393049 RepID=UPI0011856DEA|nr:glycosyltransferase [Flavobacterium daemonense]KAF2332512.1 glycosyltransferase [Flavobacterium daemonense]
MCKLSPIALFCYKRLDTLIKTVEALQKNNLAAESELYVFLDAAKNEEEKYAVNDVRNYIKTIEGFKKIIISESEFNRGLATSIIEGVNQILKNNETVIVLEDDLVSSPNFLDFMNQALNFYKEAEKVFSITGFSIPINCGKSSLDVYFTTRSSSWGWATWKNRWQNIDWEIADYHEFNNNRKSRRDFNKMGSDMSTMLDRQMQGKINSWAIRWCYHQFKNNLFSIHPFVSKIDNIGFDSADACNTKEKFNRYETLLDKSNTTEFRFSYDFCLEPVIIKQFTRPFSISSRLQYKIINSFFKN